MRVSRRMAGVVAVACATAGLVLGSALPALADTAQAYAAANAVGAGGCGALLLSAQVSAGGPAAVSLYVENDQTALTCVGWLERAVRGGRWTALSKLTVPSNGALVTSAKSADYADGPGLAARACLRLGRRAITCTGALRLRASRSKDTGGRLPLGFTQRAVTDDNDFCLGDLSSTTPGKTAASVVHVSVTVSGGSRCAGVLEESADHGKTWRAASAWHAIPGRATEETIGFTAGYADGRGRLARVCIISARKQYCSGGW